MELIHGTAEDQSDMMTTIDIRRATRDATLRGVVTLRLVLARCK